MQESEKSHVLVVDDPASARKELRRCLADSPFVVSEVGSAADVLHAVSVDIPDLILSEVKLPDASGFSLCRSLREIGAAQHIRVVLMSEWVSEMDRLLAFECGADDFVAKPFYARELPSRLSALLRRGRNRPDGPGEATNLMPLGETRVSSVRINGQTVHLTPKEHEILEALAAAGGRVLSRQELLEICGDESASPALRSIDAHVKSLRRKLGPESEAVETVRGVGYRFAYRSALALE